MVICSNVPGQSHTGACNTMIPSESQRDRIKSEQGIGGGGGAGRTWQKFLWSRSMRRRKEGTEEISKKWCQRIFEIGWKLQTHRYKTLSNLKPLKEGGGGGGKKETKKHIIIKLHKTNENQKVWKAARKKKGIIHRKWQEGWPWISATMQAAWRLMPITPVLCELDEEIITSKVLWRPTKVS